MTAIPPRHGEPVDWYIADYAGRLTCPQSNILRKFGRGRSSEDATASAPSFGGVHSAPDEESPLEAEMRSTLGLPPPVEGQGGQLSDSPYHTQRTNASAPLERTEMLLSPVPSHLRPPPIPGPPSVRGRGASTGSRSPARPESTRPELIRSPAEDPTDSLGLRLLHSPEDAVIDFIFVHGLGGSSMKTWTYQKNPNNFWPLWLPHEPGLSGARIFTFGYNTKFKGRGAGTSLNITDVAKDLLWRIATFEDVSNDMSPKPYGEGASLVLSYDRC